MGINKLPLEQNVLEASRERIRWVLQNFSRVCVSFSGGKDSSVMLNLTAQLARELNKKINILFIDWEAQFSHTIEHVERVREACRDVTDRFYWVALPLTTQNGLSQFAPTWQCWEPGVEWVRQPPEDAITSPEFFSFYTLGMTFEAFVTEFADWFARNRPAAMMVGPITGFWQSHRCASCASPMINPGRPPRRAAMPGISTLFMTGKPLISGPGLLKPKRPTTSSTI